MAKRVKFSEELVYELFTKIKNIFKKDLYLYKNIEMYAGEISEEDNDGTLMCVISLEYIEALNSVLSNERESDLYYIDDVTLFRDQFESVIESKKKGEYVNEFTLTHISPVSEDDTNYLSVLSVRDRIAKVRDNIDNNVGWTTMSSVPEDVLKTIWTEKDSVFLKNENNLDRPSIVVGKKLFPLVTLSNINKLYYAMIPVDEKNGMHAFVTFMNLPYFDIYAMYFYLAIMH